VNYAISKKREASGEEQTDGEDGDTTATEDELVSKDSRPKEIRRRHGSGKLGLFDVAFYLGLLDVIF
jgi:hypothetical protein